ncbi:hypothetical protein IIA79_00225 [bacterium]|nr:hypothetical protein [bacterium]
MAEEQQQTEREDRPLELGWFTLCLKASDLNATLDFYKKLSFEVVGGNPEHGYAVINNAHTELTPMGFLESNLLNFRGGNIPELAGELAGRGLELTHHGDNDPTKEAVEHIPGYKQYDPSKWPPEYNNDKDGNPLPYEDSGDFIIMDPDGNTLYFDSVPAERARYKAGNRFCAESVTGELNEGQLLLGNFTYCLNVKDISVSVDFYRELGLTLCEEHRGKGWAVLGYDEPSPFRLSLYQGHIKVNLLNFRGGDVFAIFPSWLLNVPRFDLDASGTVSGGDIFKIFPWWLISCT